MSRLTPEDLARELIDQAWEAEDDVERVRLVLRALARYPDHADGYVLLAQQVDDDLVAVRALYERAEQLQACNATLSVKLTREISLRTLEHRMERDKQRIRQALKPMQAEAVIALAQVEPSMARAAKADGNDRPYVTRAAVAAVVGKDEKTVGANLKVVDLPESPVSRCRAMEFRPQPDGSWRCLKSGHDPRVFEQLVAEPQRFEPSAEWQIIPDGYPCPPGGEFRMDFKSGKNTGRWRHLAEPVAVVAGGDE